MSEKRLLKKAGRYENLLRTYSELADLNAEKLYAEAEKRSAAAEKEIRRELADKNFDSLNPETIRSAILQSRVAAEEKQYLDLQMGALRAGRSLSDEELAALAKTHEKRLAEIRENTER